MGVANGTVFEAGDFRVRVGDLRQTQPVQRVRGCLVEIEYRGPGKATNGSLSGGGNEDSDWFEFLAPGEGAKTAPTITTAAAASQPGITSEEGDVDDLVGFLEFPNTADVEDDLPTEDDWREGEALIREFWSRFAVPGAKEAIRVPGLRTEVEKARQRGTKRVTTVDAGMYNTGVAGTDLARQYMEVLRFNR